MVTDGCRDLFRRAWLLQQGLTIGIVGNAGVRANARLPRLSVNMILNPIFAKALRLHGFILGLYGFILGLVVASTAEGKGTNFASHAERHVSPTPQLHGSHRYRRTTPL